MVTRRRTSKTQHVPLSYIFFSFFLIKQYFTVVPRSAETMLLMVLVALLQQQNNCPASVALHDLAITTRVMLSRHKARFLDSSAWAWQVAMPL